jgi:sulfopropanediol 3-dehydrogenase
MPDYVKRPGPAPAAETREVRDTVARIIDEVERDGEAALRRWSGRLDGWDPESFRVTREEIERATAAVDPELRARIDFARDQVAGFARRQRDTMHDLECETLPGAVLGHRHVPVSAVGSYSPGGRYPLVASAIMTITVPKVAGVRRVVACAPPRPGGAAGGEPGGIHAPQLYAMASAGADEVVCIGGAQALAALAFGIGGIDAVDMLVGPGNAYVAEAKRQLFGRVGIDLLAGPTEVAIIADETADPDTIAVDLLAQAEHGPTSPSTLITDSHDLAAAAAKAVDERLKTWPTADVAGRAWRDRGAIAVCADAEEMAALCDQLAPEHVQVLTRYPHWFRHRLRSYGSLFLGPSTTVAFGDKGVGTNHVLPTSGAARYTGGLWVGKFLKTLTWQELTPQAAAAVAEPVAAICDAEQMLGHAVSARLRGAAPAPVATAPRPAPGPTA